MNWIVELCNLYDQNAHLAGKQEPGGTVLIPLYHSTVTAQITVTIDGEGAFLRGESVPNEEKLTIIPVTDSSACRTSSPSPHPLCDTLEYLAGDYGKYVSAKDCSEKHMLYMEQLEKWAASSCSHKKVEAVCRYLQKGTLIADLIRDKVLLPDENGKLSEKVKMQAAPQTKAFVRFRIDEGWLPDSDMLEDMGGEHCAECWKDRTLQESYISWCRSQRDNPGLSYLTGEIQQISYLQPKKIRNEGDGAKLISSNDTENFTYLGRFATREEAFAIGYEDSQKVHNALKWIIRKQGKNYDSMCLVTWESDLQKIPDWQKDTDSICAEMEENEMREQEEQSDEAGEVDFSQLTDVYEEKESDTGEMGAARFQRALAGYGKDLSQSSQTVIMAFDAATTGRLAMLEFKEYASSRYLDALQRWYDRCEWIHEKAVKEKGRYRFTGMPGIRDIAEILYGTEQKGFFSMAGKEERCKDVARKLLPCILDGREVPKEMVSLAVCRASSPQSFESRFLWERVLTLACSLVKQQYIAERKENWTMALDVTCTKRDYLYGRLLAVADRIEYRTYDKDDNRQTNAKRYMSAFSQHPFRTWKVIEERLEPYLIRLVPPERIKYQKLLDEISDGFTVEDFANDMPLSGLYLLGFHNQACALKKKEEKENE